MTANPGWLRITTTSPPGRDLIGSIVNAPRVMAASSLSGDFTVETKVSASMTQNDEGAGILIWKDSSQFLRFERMSRTIGNPVQQQIMFSVNGGSFKNVILSSSINPTYLKLIKSGYSFAAYYSSDGSSWTSVGNLTFGASDPVSIGLDAINVYHSDTFVANFDYFRYTPTATPTPTPSPTPTPTPTPTPSPSGGLVGHWTFDEGYGYNVGDSSGKGNDGTIIGTASWVNGVSGTALHLNGSYNYVLVSDSESLDFEGIQPFTLMAWIKPDNPQGQSGLLRASVIDKYTNYRLIYDDPDADARGIVFSSNSNWYHSGQTVISSGVWHHYVGVYDPPYLRVYVDGFQLAYRNVGNLHLEANSQSLVLGSNMTATAQFNGSIDDVSIYSKALNSTEILNAFEELSPQPSPTPSPPPPTPTPYIPEPTVTPTWTPYITPTAAPSWLSVNSMWVGLFSLVFVLALVGLLATYSNSKKKNIKKPPAQTVQTSQEVCSECNQHFATKDEMLRHYYQVHSQQPQQNATSPANASTTIPSTTNTIFTLRRGEQLAAQLDKTWQVVKQPEKFEWSESMFRFELLRQAVLTNKRLVVLNENKIDYELPLNLIKGVEKQSAGQNTYLKISLWSGEVFSLIFVSVGLKMSLGSAYMQENANRITDHWMQAIKQFS